MRTHQESPLEQAILLSQLRAQQLPWIFAVYGEYGFRPRCRFRSYGQAASHARAYRQAFNAPEDWVSVSHVDDGAELLDLEWMINVSRSKIKLESARLRPRPERLYALQSEMQRLIEEAILLCEMRGWVLRTTFHNELMRLEIDKRV